MGSLEALQLYWSSPGPLAALLVHGSFLASLGVLYQFTSRPAWRLRLLYSMYAADVSLWSFFAASLLLCVALSDELEYETTGLKLVTSMSVFGGLLVGALAGTILTTSRTAHRAHLARLGVGDPQDLSSSSDPTIVVSERPGLFAASSSLQEPLVIVSRELLKALAPEELDAVIAHEAAHIANRDSRRRLASVVLSRCMFFDPLSKFLDPAIHREGELLADEVAALDPTSARALASALRKLGSLCSGVGGTSSASRLRSRHVPLEGRLRRIATIHDASRDPSGA